MRRLLAAVVIAAAIGGIVWWLLQGPKPAPPVIPATSAPATIAQPESAPESKPTTRKITPTALAESASEQPESRAALGTVMRGRCLDAANAAPIAGCTATLRGNGRERWTSPAPVATGPDGRFEIRFDPPSPYAFFLFVDGPGHASMMGRFPNIEPGSVVDVGDVAMHPGTAVRGRVLDADGAPLGGVSFSFDFVRPEARAELNFLESFSARSGADGTFAISRPMQVGKFRVSIQGDQKLVEPETLEIVAGESERSVDVKVRGESAADTILGVVRDDLGQPIRNASIDYEPQGWDARNMSRLVTSDKDGVFRIVRVNQDRQAEVSIKARCTGYEPSASPTKAGWGSTDVVLVLLRGRTVRIVVRDGDENKPLERYGVRCFPAPSFMGRRSSTEGELRERGEHADGVLELGGVPRGRQVLIVEPDGEQWAPSAGQEFEMTDSGAPRQDVTVWRTLKKTVRVKRQDGSPVAKSRVDLLRRISDGPIDQETHAAKSGQLWMMSGSGIHALVLAEGVTSDDGTVELAGPPREPLVLRALGPGHVPLVREVEFTPAEGVIDLVVLSGATFVGRLQPPEVLRELAGPDPPPLRPGRTPSRGSLSGVFLRHKTTRLEHPVREAAPLDADGGFRVEGVPAGAWDVHLRYPEPMGGGSSTIKSHKIGAVDLVDGQERRESYDVSYLVKAEVEGVVTLDGEPLEDASVGFDGTRELADGETRVDTNLIMRLQPGGKFRMALFPADYRLVAHLRGGKRSRLVYDDEVFRLAPGQKLAKTFDLRSSVSKLRVMASDGVTPVGGISLLFDVPKSSWPAKSEPTGDDGTVDVEGLPPGPIPVLVWPKNLSTDEALRAHMRSRPGKGLFKADLTPVTTITITPPQTSATIVLPASAGY